MLANESEVATAKRKMQCLFYSALRQRQMAHAAWRTSLALLPLFLLNGLQVSKSHQLGWEGSVFVNLISRLKLDSAGFF